MASLSHDLSAASPPAVSIAPLPRVSLQAFCETTELAALIAAAADDRRMEKTHVKVNMGGATAAVEAYRTSPTPNVILVETSTSRQELTEQLEALAEFCDAGTKVVVAGHENDISLYRELMTRGVSEYLVQPFAALDLIASLSALYNDDRAAPVGRLIAVTGCKGGVGASCVAHNLAWSVARDLDLATVIIDLDLPFGTTGLDFNQDPPQGVAEAVFAPDRLDANMVDRLLSKCSDKLSLLTAPATVERTCNLQESSFDPLIEILKATTPYIVLDIPHVWTAWSRRLLATADETIVVASPGLASLRNIKSLFDHLRAARRNDFPPRYVLNGVNLPKRPEITIEDFATAVEAEPAAVIPFDARLFGAAANNGLMIGETEDGAKTAQIFRELARLVTGRSAVRRRRKRILEPLFAAFNG
jgi:pilus assembly protein CpaE